MCIERYWACMAEVVRVKCFLLQNFNLCLILKNYFFIDLYEVLIHHAERSYLSTTAIQSVKQTIYKVLDISIYSIVYIFYNTYTRLLGYITFSKIDANYNYIIVYNLIDFVNFLMQNV